ncbi:hypothetical protein [Sphingomonas sp.]|uniref:hypothetical protein n=1 Tax=Sphingomonas sp. TaxID=28214 RepID=UPI0033404CA5
MRGSAVLLAALLLLVPIAAGAQVKLDSIDAQVRDGMAKTGAKGIAIAVIDRS